MSEIEERYKELLIFGRLAPAFLTADEERAFLIEQQAEIVGLCGALLRRIVNLEGLVSSLRTDFDFVSRNYTLTPKGDEAGEP